MMGFVAGTSAAQLPSTMTQEPNVLTAAELDRVIGGGIGTQIGSLFGEKGAKWGGIADSIFGIIQGNGGLGNIFGSLLGGLGGGGGSAPSSGSSPAPAAPQAPQQQPQAPAA